MPDTSPRGQNVHRHRAASTVRDAAVAYVPRLLVEQIAASPERAFPWCEWVEGTLVMADVSGFTALSEKLAQAGKEGAEWLTDVIDRFFGRMLDIAWEFGGTTITFGGDAILLLFYGDGHERRGVAAALQMLEGTRRLSALRVGAHRVKLTMSMGAHAGRFLTMAAGTHDSAQYLVLGPETVRTAEAEARASSGELAITSELAVRLGKAVMTEPLDEFVRVVEILDVPQRGFDPRTVEPAVSPAALMPFLPPAIAEALRDDPHGEPPVVESEHRNVTVVFVNVLGVDDLLATSGSEALRDEVQRYLRCVVDVLAQNQGYLVSNDIYTNGFKLIVAFGAPVAHERDAENAFRFVTALRERIARESVRLAYRIGVNGGFVFAGDIGPAYRRQYTIMGDAVNLSARLMGAAETGQAIVSQSSGAAAGDCFHVRELAPVRVKGKQHAIEIGVLEGERRPVSTCAAGAGTGAFLGRESELATLVRASEQVESGPVRSVVVRGDAGMGKSRLIAEFERVVLSRGWSVRTAKAFRHTSGQPFAPWVPLLEQALGLGVEADLRARSDVALETVEGVGDGLAEWACLLNPVMNLDIPETASARSLDGASRRNRQFDVMVALLSGVLEDRPVALHLEDAHWADGSSLELLSRLARASRHGRLLLIASERLEGATELELPQGSTTLIELAELSKAAALGLVRAVVGVDLPEAPVEVMLAKARGNPLFLQEVARSIASSGAIDSALDDREMARRIQSTEVPDSVQGLLMSQIDALSPHAKEVVRAAAVVGSTFTEDVLRGSTGAPQAVDSGLAELCARALLLRDPGERGSAYSFRHALIQEVTYDSLPFAQRRRLHHQVAEYLERSRGATIEHVYESLVHHYSLSGDSAKTRVFALKAGDKASAMLAQRQAIEFFEIGMRAVGARTTSAACARGVLLERVGDCQDAIGRHDLAARAYEQALARSRSCARSDASDVQALLGLTEPVAQVDRVARLCVKIATSYTRTHRDYARSLRWLDRAADALPPRSSLLAARIEQIRGVALLWLGRHGEAAACARRALPVARRYGDRVLQARAATNLAGVFLDTGRTRLSARYDLLALQAYSEVGDLRGQAEAHANLVADYTLQGRLDEALTHSREALAIYNRTGDLTAMAITECNVGEILVMQGRNDEAMETLSSALAHAQRAGGSSTTIGGFALLNLSRALAALGRNDEALERIDESQARLREAGSSTFLAEARVLRAYILLASGRVDDSLAECEHALSEARQLDMRLIEARALRVQGLIAERAGNVVEAEDLFGESEATARRASSKYEQGASVLSRAELRMRTGRSHRRDARRAIALLESTGAAPEIARAKALLEGVS